MNFWRENNNLIRRETLPGINDPIKWKEVNSTLHDLRTGKAPGPDGIPTEILKAAAEPVEEAGDTPKSPLGKVILEIINKMWFETFIPQKWRLAHVVSIPKKGDLYDMDNYRGISLINVVVKLLSTLIIRRIYKAVERKKLIRPEQAGFRSREECVGQVLSLIHI